MQHSVMHVLRVKNPSLKYKKNLMKLLFPKGSVINIMNDN